MSESETNQHAGWLAPGPPGAALCPECRDGKHGNCTEQVLDEDDEWVPCGCTHPREGM